jgi:cation:H+ antiporter
MFLGASFLMIWRLEAMSKSGLEGTILGTLIMPYCSGLGNLVFAYLMLTRGGSGAEVIKRKGVLRVICTNPKHKQKQG